MTASLDNGVLLLDGAQVDQPLCWLYQTYPGHEPRPLLRGTLYTDIDEVGPIMVPTEPGSALREAWWQGDETLRSALWLETDLPPALLFRVLQRRLRVHSPDGREFWLRLGDARPLRQAWLAGAQWPAGFWHGVAGVWLHHRSEPVCAWENAMPELDCAPNDSGLTAQLTLDWPLLQALTLDTQSTEEAHS